MYQLAINLRTLSTQRAPPCLLSYRRASTVYKLLKHCCYNSLKRKHLDSITRYQVACPAPWPAPTQGPGPGLGPLRSTHLERLSMIGPGRRSRATGRTGPCVGQRRASAPAAAASAAPSPPRAAAPPTPHCCGRRSEPSRAEDALTRPSCPGRL